MDYRKAIRQLSDLGPAGHDQMATAHRSLANATWDDADLTRQELAFRHALLADWHARAAYLLRSGRSI